MHLCVAANDFSYFEARTALQEKQPDLFRNEFHQMVAGDFSVVANGPLMARTTTDTLPAAPSKNIDAELKKDAEDQNQQIQESMNAAVKDAEHEAKNAPKDPSKVDAWKEKLRDNNKARIAEITAQMNKATDTAIAKIQKLPEKDRAPAATKWDEAQDWILKALGKLQEALTKAWEGLVEAWNAVVDWVNGAIAKVKEWGVQVGQAVQQAADKIVEIFSLK